MSTDLFINPTGANSQAEATLAYLRHFHAIEESWEDHDYQARPTVARWENCREQGYVVSLRTKDYSKQLNIAFFEHRNTDSICAVKWEQNTINAPTIDTMKADDVYKDKYDTSHDVGYGKAQEMAAWIYAQLEEFWVENNKGD